MKNRKIGLTFAAAVALASTAMTPAHSDPISDLLLLNGQVIGIAVDVDAGGVIVEQPGTLVVVDLTPFGVVVNPGAAPFVFMQQDAPSDVSDVVAVCNPAACGTLTNGVYFISDPFESQVAGLPPNAIFRTETGAPQDVSSLIQGGRLEFASDVNVPGPIVGAGLPGLVLACGSLIALARRRRLSAAGGIA